MTSKIGMITRGWRRIPLELARMGRTVPHMAPTTPWTADAVLVGLRGFYHEIASVGLVFPGEPCSGTRQHPYRTPHRSPLRPTLFSGSVDRSSALISRICARTAPRVSTFSRVQTPRLKLPLRSPRGPPEPLAPPCIRHRARLRLWSAAKKQHRTACNGQPTSLLNSPASQEPSHPVTASQSRAGSRLLQPYSVRA
jgi:hypothetical protein